MALTTREERERIVEQELSVVVRVASSSVSHVVPHMKNHHDDNFSTGPDKLVLFGKLPCR